MPSAREDEAGDAGGKDVPGWLAGSRVRDVPAELGDAPAGHHEGAGRRGLDNPQKGAGPEVQRALCQGTDRSRSRQQSQAAENPRHIPLRAPRRACAATSPEHTGTPGDLSDRSPGSRRCELHAKVQFKLR